jgi:hypothetical protein
MLRILLGLFCTLILFPEFAVKGHAQGCPDGLLLKPGAFMEFKSYKKKRKKPAYTAKHYAIEQEILEDRTLLHLKCAYYGEDTKVQRSFDYFIGCKDGKMILDKEVLSDPDNLTLFEDKEFSFDGKNIHYPNNVKPGDTIRDALHSINVSTGPVSLSTINTSLVARKVEAHETISTPAGNFDAFRISYTQELTRGSEDLKFTTRKYMVEYVVPGLGVVRSEERTKGGKLKWYTQLEKLQHPK